jgi:hypothetical protein
MGECLAPGTTSVLFRPPSMAASRLHSPIHTPELPLTIRLNPNGFFYWGWGYIYSLFFVFWGDAAGGCFASFESTGVAGKIPLCARS